MNSIKKPSFTARIFLLLGWIILFCGVVYADGPISLTVLHTNDIHGQYLPTKATWLENEPEIGGFEALSYYVREERERAGNSLLLDAGDLMTGSMICKIEYKGAYGGALIEMMNRIGYDAMTPGNHEFDLSVTNLRTLIDIADFPVLCANMSNGNEPLTDEFYEIRDLDGLKVGIIGLTYYPMRGMVADPNLEGFDSIEPVGVIDSLVAVIDPLTDVIIILSHLGLDGDRELAKSVSGIDLIVGGHSHAELHEAETVNGVLIVQAGSNCRFLGRVDMTIERDSVQDYSSELIPLLAENIEPDPEISKLVSGYNAEINDMYGKVIGKLESRWENEFGKETALGDWLSDILKKRLYTDLAIINSGAIRKGLGPGRITVKDVNEMLPFDDNIVTFGCSGRQLRTIAEQNISLQAEGFLYPLQISGLTCRWHETESGNEIDEILVNGRQIDDNHIYQVASIDYIVVYNSERYLGYNVRAYIKTKFKLTELAIDEIEKNGISESKSKNRFKKLN